MLALSYPNLWKSDPIMNHFSPLSQFKLFFLVCLLMGLSSSSYAYYPVAPLVYTPGPVVVPNSGNLLAQLHHANGVEIVQVGNQLRIILGVDCFFKHQSATHVNSAGIPTLNCIAQLLRSYGNAFITVEGHTDNVGPDQVKFARSLQQAKTIVAYLWSQGVPLENMKAVGCGDTRPVSSNKTLAGSTSNRRIEIRVG